MAKSKGTPAFKGVKGNVKNRINQFEQEQLQKVATMATSGMTYPAFLEWVENEIQQSRKMASFNHKILCCKNDGVYQLNRAIEEIFGMVTGKEDDGPSGSGLIDTIDVELFDGTRKKVPFGDISLEGLGEDSRIQISYNESNHHLYVKGQCQFRFSTLVDDIVERTRELLGKESIYRNQALEITDPSVPKIMDLSNIDKELMILSRETEEGLQALKARILHPEECIEGGVPLKFGCLLEGPYGTGKTLLAFKLAKEAIANNWIFIYLKDPTLLAETLRLSKVIDQSGNGVIVFVEDIDQVTKGKRDAAMQDILNTLDGGDTKNMNVICLFTTNHIELIEPTFLRGKRIGSVISMGALDKDTARTFLQVSFPEPQYQLDSNLDEVCTHISELGIVPAFMAEIVEAIKTTLIFSRKTQVTSRDIESRVSLYARQMGLSRVKDVSETPAEKLYSSLQECVGEPVTKKIWSACKNVWELDEEGKAL